MGAWRQPPEYLSILPRIRILLLGSYHPSFLTRLESIRDRTIEDNMNNCRLARDFSTPARMSGEPEKLYLLRKSEYWMRHADVLFFIFFEGADNSSVAVELNTALTQIPGSVWRSILTFPENVPSLVEGLGIRYQPELTVIPFTDDLDLQMQAVGNIVRLSGRLYATVSIRPDGEWEYSSQK